MSCCGYSFSDLYRAAYGRDPDPEELERLYRLPRAAINATVREWAQLAGWETREVVGSDGEVYVGFWRGDRTDFGQS